MDTLDLIAATRFQHHVLYCIGLPATTRKKAEALFNANCQAIEERASAGDPHAVAYLAEEEAKAWDSLGMIPSMPAGEYDCYDDPRD